MSFNTTLLIVIMLISIISISFIGFSISVANNYSFEVEEKYQNMFNEFDEAEQSFETYEEIIEGGEINPEGQDQAVFSNVIVAGKQAMTSAKVAGSLLTDLGAVFRINPLVIGIFFAMVAALSVGGFVYLLTGRRP